MMTDIADKIRHSNIEAHRLEAGIYDAIHPEIFGLFEQRRVDRDMELIASIMPRDWAARVLDIGCGTGNLTLKYLKQGYQVKAVDISLEMISILRSSLAPEVLNRAELVVDDAEDIVADTRTYGTWDIVSFSAVLHHLPDYKVVLAHSLRQLRPGGVLYVCREPLRKSSAKRGLVFPLVGKIVDSLDNLYIYARKLLVYLIQSLRTRKVFKRFDYSWSDYHAELGIDAEGILLTSSGCPWPSFCTSRANCSLPTAGNISSSKSI